MKTKYLLILVIIVFFHPFATTAKSCFSDENCYDFYSCISGQCELNSFESIKKVSVTAKQGVQKKHETNIMGYNISDKERDVVIGSMVFQTLQEDSYYIIERINLYLESSGNLKIQNLRMINDVNNNGKYDDIDRVVMKEAAGQTGPFTRFLEYVKGERVLPSEKEINLMFVADFYVDKTKKCDWPVFGKIASIDSVKMSSNAEINKSYKNLVFEPVALKPWGRILFFNTENARLFPDSNGTVLYGIKIMTTEKTKIKRISFTTESIHEDGWGDDYAKFENVTEKVFLKLSVGNNDEKIYSLSTESNLKVFDIDFEIQPLVPVEMILESETVICGKFYGINFEWNGVMVSEDGYQFEGLPFYIEEETYIQDGKCSEEDESYGCTIVNL